MAPALLRRSLAEHAEPSIDQIAAGVRVSHY
jgi:hypothetical protein